MAPNIVVTEVGNGTASISAGLKISLLKIVGLGPLGLLPISPVGFFTAPLKHAAVDENVFALHR